MRLFEGKVVVLGVTGSIAIYKILDLIPMLKNEGIDVEVVMTESARKLITPLPFQSLSGKPVHTDMFKPIREYEIEHISLSRKADLILIAPATANTIAKLANGIADDLLSATVLSSRSPVIIAPAMHHDMYENPITKENIERLKTVSYTHLTLPTKA